MKNLISKLQTKLGVVGLSSLLTLSGCVQPPPRDGKAYTQEELREIENRNIGAALLEGGLLGLGMVAPNLKQAAALTGASRAVGTASNLNNQVTAAQAGRTQVNVQYPQGQQGSIQVYLAGRWEDINRDGSWDMSELKEVGKFVFSPREEICVIVDNKTPSPFRGISITSEISRFDRESKTYLSYEHNGEVYYDVEIEGSRGRLVPFRFDEKSEKRGHYKGRFTIRAQGNVVGTLEYMFQNPPKP